MSWNTFLWNCRPQEKKTKKMHQLKLIMKIFWLNYFNNYNIIIILHNAYKKLKLSLHWTLKKLLEYCSGKTDKSSPKNKDIPSAKEGWASSSNVSGYSHWCISILDMKHQVIVVPFQITRKKISSLLSSKITVFYNPKVSQSPNTKIV